jgi:hypothetical protein
MLARTVSHAGAFGFNPSKFPAFCIIVTVTESPALFAALAAARKEVGEGHNANAQAYPSPSLEIPLDRTPYPRPWSTSDRSADHPTWRARVPRTDPLRDTRVLRRTI